MHRDQLITLIIILTILVIFIFYLKHKQIEHDKQRQFESQDNFDTISCKEEVVPCLNAWYHTFDNAYRANTFSSNEYYFSVTVQNDGKIIVGSAYYSPTSFVRRFNLDGTVDTSFGPPTLPPASGGVWTMVRVAQDGSVFVSGYDYFVHPSRTSMIVIKLTPSGQLDLSFGAGLGYWVDDRSLNPNTMSEGWSLHLLPNGQILVGGIQLITSGYMSVVTRINSNGTLDTTFGSSGFASTDGSISDWGVLYGIGVQDDGKIVGGGYIGDGFGKYGLGAVRFLSNGTLDTTYNAIGFNVYNYDGIDEPAWSAMFANGKMYVGGVVFVSLTSDRRAAVVRFTDSGSLDLSWADNGAFIENVDFGVSDYSHVGGLTPTCDGGCFATGFVQNIEGASFICKLDADGILDLTFGDGNGFIIGGLRTRFEQVCMYGVDEVYVVGAEGTLDTGVVKLIVSEN